MAEPNTLKSFTCEGCEGCLGAVPNQLKSFICEASRRLRGKGLQPFDNIRRRLLRNKKKVAKKNAPARRVYTRARALGEDRMRKPNRDEFVAKEIHRMRVRVLCCPKCLAPPGRRCRGVRGKIRMSNHMERIRKLSKEIRGESND